MLVTKVLILASLVLTLIVPTSMNAAEAKKIQPSVAFQFIEKAKENPYWKVAFITGEHEQIVFMNISPQTNPKNEIGEEKHPFDQAILIVEGRGQSILNGETSIVREGDLIFIPKGTIHNVVNMNPQKELKIISFYSDTDIPAGTLYKTVNEQPQE